MKSMQSSHLTHLANYWLIPAEADNGAATKISVNDSHRVLVAEIAG
jgi:hypothetical protein